MKTNELIAEFMEIPKLEDYKGIMWDFQKTGKQIYSIRSQELAYDRSWDWLMPVVEKIGTLYSTAFPPGERFIEMILAHEDPIDRHFTDVLSCPISTPIDEVYKAVVEFIKWHNNQQNP